MFVYCEDESNVGVSELETWGKPKLPVSPPAENVNPENLAFHTVANIEASYTSTHDDVTSINDGIIRPTSAGRLLSLLMKKIG